MCHSRTMSKTEVRPLVVASLSNRCTFRSHSPYACLSHSAGQNILMTAQYITVETRTRKINSEDLRIIPHKGTWSPHLLPHQTSTTGRKQSATQLIKKQFSGSYRFNNDRFRKCLATSDRPFNGTCSISMSKVTDHNNIVYKNINKMSCVW